jgi:hypothetical protein
MPIDPHAYDDDDDLDAGAAAGHRRRFTDFDCPSCAANNPYDDGFGDGDEVLCYYCGQEYRAEVSDEGRLRLREA